MTNIYDLLIANPGRFKQLRVKDLLFVHYHCPQEIEKINIYSHLNFIVYAISGERSIVHSCNNYTLSKGKCFFVKKGAFQQQMKLGNDLCVMAFFMPDSYLKKFIDEYRSKIPFTSQKIFRHELQEQVTDMHVNNTTKTFFYAMKPYFLQPLPPVEELLELKFRELIFNLLCDPVNKSFRSHLFNISNCNKPSLADIMEANYMYHLSLTEFAKISNRSLATFKREFTKMFHSSPGKWLTYKRLQHAKMLLQTSIKNISEIADESGFENNTHFSKIFKDAFGVSPRQYQHNYTFNIYNQVN
ncbi:MAG: helix-turn-helix transcriptional regulator [Bacteroidetes bacterium]|nr:helix-turn-helix transcriptional regulator [Bacteroidota bacterium]